MVVIVDDNVKVENVNSIGSKVMIDVDDKETTS